MTRDPVKAPSYRYAAKITHIYDADTVRINVDLYDHIWKQDEIVRLYGLNAMEIKRSRSKGITTEDVKVGYQQRDELFKLLGVFPDPDLYPHRVRYQELAEPVWVVIETVRDKSGKFGRLLGIIHKDGVNINEAMRDVIGAVEFYDGKTWPADTPIRPPA